MRNLQPKQAHVFLTWQLKLLAAQVLTDRPPIGAVHLVAPSLALSVHQYVNKVLDSWQTGNLSSSLEILMSFPDI
jgi:hypothetical protein